jgi:hypothetical protein
LFHFFILLFLHAMLHRPAAVVVVVVINAAAAGAVALLPGDGLGARRHVVREWASAPVVLHRAPASLAVPCLEAHGGRTFVDVSPCREVDVATKLVSESS